MNYKKLKLGEKITFRCTDTEFTETTSVDYVGTVIEVSNEYALIKCDLLITPEKKRKNDIIMRIDDDTKDIFEII